MAKAGRRKPRKQISSNMGARRVPNAVTSQTSEGVRKKSSMGMDLGTGMREEMACTAKPKARPMGMSLRALRRGGEVPLEAGAEGAVPEEGEKEERDDEGGDVGDGLG